MILTISKESEKNARPAGLSHPLLPLSSSDTRTIWAMPSMVVTSPSSSSPFFDWILQLKRAREHISIAYGVRRWTISLFPGIPDLSGTVTTIWPLVGWTVSCVIDLLRRMLFLWKAARGTPTWLQNNVSPVTGKRNASEKTKQGLMSAICVPQFIKETTLTATKWTRWRIQPAVLSLSFSSLHIKVVSLENPETSSLSLLLPPYLEVRSYDK